MKILNLPLARSRVDRAEHLRSDPIALEALWERARVLHFDGEKFLTTATDGVRGLRYLKNFEAPDNGEEFFLGLDGNQPYFLFMSAQIAGEEENYKTLREIGGLLDDLQIGLAVHSQGLGNWHRKHPRCSSCGAPTAAALGGSIRECSQCAVQHYPRTDPAIIVLVKDSHDRILLGRQKVWPEHRFSTFAGFVETGESFEQCVSREVAEEAGVLVSDVRYLGSQPWPFPASLMIAFEATILDPENARPDGEEIEEIRWFDRDSIIEEIQVGELLLPPKISVARAMIQSWYDLVPLADGSARPTFESIETPHTLESWRK
jgi:NAD+ diphosphatase